MSYTVNFPRDEFVAASNLPLTAADELNAQHFATNLLQPARRALGFPIFITAFKERRITGVHPQGKAIDFGVAGNDPEKLEQLFTWLATFKSREFGKLIHERNHLHATVPGAQGAFGEVWREPVEGEYVLAVIGASLRSPWTYVVLFLLGYLIVRSL